MNINGWDLPAWMEFQAWARKHTYANDLIEIGWLYDALKTEAKNITPDDQWSSFEFHPKGARNGYGNYLLISVDRPAGILEVFRGKNDAATFRLGDQVAYGEYTSREEYCVDHAPDQESFDAIARHLDLGGAVKVQPTRDCSGNKMRRPL